jgi:hypothetical protein
MLTRSTTINSLVGLFENGDAQLPLRLIRALANPDAGPPTAEELALAVQARALNVAAELLRFERSGVIVHGTEDGVERYALSASAARLVRILGRVPATAGAN